MQADAQREALEAFAAGQPALEPGGRLGARLGDAPEQQHLGAEAERQRAHVGGPLAAQDGDGLGELVGVANLEAERLVHRRQQRAHLEAEPPSQRHERARERARACPRRQEGAAPDLDVHHEGVRALGDLLREDRGRDERDRLDGRRGVAQGIEEAIGRHEARALAGEHEPRARQHAPKLRGRERRPEAGDGLELVERAARVAEAAPRHHGDGHAAGRDERREAERDLVAHAARRVLVDLAARDGAEAQALARGDHGLRPRHELARVEAAPHDRHEQRRQLVLGNGPRDGAADDGADLGVVERAPVALLGDERGHG